MNRNTTGTVEQAQRVDHTENLPPLEPVSLSLVPMGGGWYVKNREISCFLLGTWRVKVVFNHVRWFLSDLRGDDEKARKAERDIGLILSEKLLEKTPKASHVRQTNWVQGIGERLIHDIRWKKGERRDFTFQVVESKHFNACAIPGGFIFVSDSLIEFCDGNEEELAFVLAHEMAHVLCGHAKQR